jgi:hypothetical protein
MTLAQLFHAPPAELFLCPDCGQVGNSPASCPGCANAHGLLNLGKVLNREVTCGRSHNQRSLKRSFNNSKFALVK